MSKLVQKMITELEQGSRRHDLADMFTRFIRGSFAALCMGRAEGLWGDTARGLDEAEIRLLHKLFALLSSHDEGPADVLGEMYMEVRSRFKGSALGQYFTPFPVCEMIAGVAGGGIENPTVNDPACGSGAMLLAHASVSGPGAWYIGQDVDAVCCMMAAVQMCLFGLQGEVHCMDTIGMHHQWCVVVNPLLAIYRKPGIVPCPRWMTLEGGGDPRTSVYRFEAELDAPRTVRYMLPGFAVDQREQWVNPWK